MNAFKHNGILYYYKIDVENWIISTNRSSIFFFKKKGKEAYQWTFQKHQQFEGPANVFEDCNSFTIGFPTSGSGSIIFSKQG